MNSDPCDICASASRMQPELEVSLSGVLIGWVHRCGDCGFRQIRPRLSRTDLDLLYSDAYFDEASTMGFSDYPRQEQRNQRTAWTTVGRMRRLDIHGPILEVGCALGFFLDGLRRYTDVPVRGVDISSFAAHFAREHYGLDIVRGTLEEAAFPDATFGFVIAKDLLEHVISPRALLQEVHRILRPGGWAWIITPNGKANLSPLYRMAQSRQSSATIPMLTQGHLSFFSRQHLDRLLKETGFEVERFRSIGLRRGLRALGLLPAKRRSRHAVQREEVASARPSPTVETHRELATRVEQSLLGVHRNYRSHPMYFRFRNVQTRLDTVPGWIPLGMDFDIWVRKR